MKLRTAVDCRPFSLYSIVKPQFAYLRRKQMNLQHLKYFRAVYECKNITKAANRLHISQPAVSSALKELETEFGVPLFERQNRGLAPTEEGIVFYSLACRIMAQCDSAKQVIREVAQHKSQVRVGMAPMVGAIVFPLIYEKLYRTYPEIALEILEDGSCELIKRLEEDRVEMIIVPDGVELKGGLKRKIYETGMVFAISREHPLACRDSLTLEQISTVPLAIYQKGYIQTQNITDLFESHGLPMKVMARVSNYMTVKTLVHCGAFGAFLMREVCEHDKSLRTYEVPELKPTSVYLFWKEDGYLSGAAKGFLKCCRDLSDIN